VAGLVPGPEFAVRFMLLFLLGGLGHLFAERIRFHPLLLLLATGTVLVSTFVFFDYRPLGAVPFAYLILWAMVALPVRWTSTTDLSYGLYIFHWPVALVLIAAGVPRLGAVGFTLTEVLVTGTLAITSWYLIEAPALRRKDARWIDAVPAWFARAVRTDQRRRPLPSSS
jgi:peptidoglycan/LPS O-acetylase OafA/YrhL